MTERNGATFDVNAVHSIHKFHFFDDRKRLSSERFVELDVVNIVEAQTRPLKRFLVAVTGPRPMTAGSPFLPWSGCERAV